MPVDEDFSIDSPEGLSDEDIQKLNEQANELESKAKLAEESAEKIKEAKKVFEGMDFAQINALNQGENVSIPTAGAGGINLKSKEDLTTMIVEILEELEEQKKKLTEEMRSRKELENEVEMMKNDIKKGIRQTTNALDEIDSLGSNPFNFAKGKVMGAVGKAGVAGVIIMATIKIAEFIYDKIEKSYGAGGVNDVRKLMLDRDREIGELNDILARRNGRVFFTGDIDLKQGAPMFSNTERLRDQMIRYQALHLGE